MAKSLEEITKFIENVHFRKKLLFGVDEGDVRRVMSVIQNEYTELFTAEQSKSKAYKDELDNMKLWSGGESRNIKINNENGYIDDTSQMKFSSDDTINENTDYKEVTLDSDDFKRFFYRKEPQ